MHQQEFGILKSSIILIFLFLVVLGLNANGQSDGSDLESTVEEILDHYDPQSLSLDDALAIHADFKEAGIKGGPDLDTIINNNGFDAEQLRTLVPPPDGPRHIQGEKREPSVPVFSSLEQDFGPAEFSLFSPAIDEKGELFNQYKCEKKDNNIEKSIPLNWTNIPEGTGSLAIVMYHFPNPGDRSHVNSYLLLWGIEPSIMEIPHGMADQGDWYMGSNKDGNAISYTSPCSKGPGSHKYTIAIFALSGFPEELPAHSSRDINFESFMTAIEKQNILGKAELNFLDIRK
ncbi:hypothetical protein EXM22_13505 [Oceanispirochaeta crateris]|uniref:YbhB/YbcL family Raf kinase inhibitor-like protein n=1 Tax=Oceanispirochaeta crateris TaxID=2518645 RepID=A0A5C1QP03_9SPIO|nr:hypothetical protein [Oceanispirochaeta crateris]QEN08959.1 hypothetical protein EXM22_13505 [Oceanispirochaeta crateris]